MTDSSKVQSSSPAISMTRQDLASDTSEQLAITIAQAADDRKAADISVLKVGGVSYLADYFVVATGFSNVQVRAIARAIADKAQEQHQRLPLRTEGQGDGSWVLQDYGDVIVHIFLPEAREFYNLEAFWGHAEKINFSN